MNRCLIGKTLTHSYSSIIHEYFEKSPYKLVEIEEEDLKSFFLNIKNNSFPIDFLNVTIPYKQKVIPYLDKISREAKEIKAVNLICNYNNELSGYNTDYFAFTKMLKNNNITVYNKSVCVLGTGGSSQMVKYYLEKNNPSSITFVSRTKKGPNIINYSDLEKGEAKEFQILINCTPQGMFPNIIKSLNDKSFNDKSLNDLSFLDLNKINGLEVVIDLIYNPFRTVLIQKAKQLNIYAINGIEMLIYQAIYSNLIYQILIDTSNKDKNIIDFDDEKIKKTVLEIEKILKRKQNIVLIGMPGCGKSTISKKLASIIPYKLIDTDEEIVKAHGDINNIFSRLGEKHFRKLETEVIKDITSSTDAPFIISLGGGAILSEENMILLKANGVIIYLEVELEKIVIDENRPLMKNEEQKLKLFNNRKHLYEKYADIKIKNVSIEETINKIIENLEMSKL